jgi:F-type H+-transporting ATPase subunit gamma
MRKRIERTEDLQSVVGTMKALAAVSIRQYEQAAASIDEFYRTVRLGLRIVLGNFNPHTGPERSRGGRRVAVILGSDQGMCGKFNEDIYHFTGRHLAGAHAERPWHVLAVGERIASLLQQDNASLIGTFSVPGSTDAITPLVQDILARLGGTEELSAVKVLFNRHVSGAAYEPTMVQLLPLDRQWLDAVCRMEWPTHQLPAFRVERNRLFADLIRHYLFVSLYRAAAHSLAGENASRLAAMQVAEKNIEERLGGLTTLYHRQRQSAITEELLDIVSGFEVLS